MAAKSLKIKHIWERDIQSYMYGGASIELSQRFIKGLIDGLPEKEEKTNINCHFCKGVLLILEYKPPRMVSDGAYIFRCPKCLRKFWGGMV